MKTVGTPWRVKENMDRGGQGSLSLKLSSLTRINAGPAHFYKLGIVLKLWGFIFLPLFKILFIDAVFNSSFAGLHTNVDTVQE